MSKLDQPKYIASLDRSQMLESIKEINLQCQQVWNDWRGQTRINMPAHYRKSSNIVLNGMGGSALAAHVVQSLYRDSLKTPFEFIHGYSLPKIVGRNTLYIIASYSGDTEEPIATFNEARRRQADIFIITKGGKLATLARRHGVPAYIFEEKHNPCQQPRMGVGYNLTSLFALLNRLGIIRVTEKDFQIAKSALERGQKLFSLEKPIKSNLAKKIAQKLHGAFPVIIASEHLEGSAHIFANQINENGKNFSLYQFIPELNHHLLEGLEHPRLPRRLAKFLFLESSLYHPHNQKRHTITKKIVRSHGLEALSYQAWGRQPIEQVFEILSFGSYVGFYLAILNRIDPSPIPWVDYFKAELKKRH
ncbi:MAG: SIS domain-containing protein [Patescibacteria group bacterium]|nr:SIS domain-containing protein [Patescibacteria group bacterium]